MARSCEAIELRRLRRAKITTRKERLSAVAWVGGAAAWCTSRRLIAIGSNLAKRLDAIGQCCCHVQRWAGARTTTVAGWESEEEGSERAEVGLCWLRVALDARHRGGGR